MNEMNDIRDQIRKLREKAALKQSMEDACPGHLWITDYVSKLVGGSGSCRCEICGTRRSWEDANKEGQWKYDLDAKN